MSDDKKSRDPEAVSGGNQGKEPQSYGSESDWLTGKTGQTVANTPDRVSRHDEDFYDSRHEQEGETPAVEADAEDPGRAVSPVRTTDSPSTVTRAGDAVEERDSFFKDRDYDKS